MISGNSGSGGGLENVVRELTKVLVKNEIHVTVFTCGPRDNKTISQNCIEFQILPYNILPSKLGFANYEKYLYSLKVWKKIGDSANFDIIHGHGDNCLFQALFRNKTPLVTNIHGVKKAYRYRVFGPNSPYTKGPRVFPLFWPEEIAAKKSDITVACSKSEKEELVSFYGADPLKIRVIYNGVDTAKFLPMDKKLARKSLGLPEDKNYAIWVGNNPQLKGLDVAIQAVKGLANLYLLVVGVSGNNFGNVIFWGMVENKRKLVALYNASDFLMLPTLYEGFPLVPLEAMACGLPIIISKECPTKEIIQNGVEGFVIDQRRPENYREQIVALLADPSKNPKTSNECRKLAEKFSWDRIGKEYLKLYLQLAR
jgi:glycosyltransferase involved in cell wall biosynthesis